jgi:hypothetical protein
VRDTQTRAEGKMEIWRGSGIPGFLARNDRSPHEKVPVSAAQLRYHHERNGKLYIGDSERFRNAARNQAATRSRVLPSSAKRRSASWLPANGAVGADRSWHGAILVFRAARDVCHNLNSRSVEKIGR